MNAARLAAMLVALTACNLVFGVEEPELLPGADGATASSSKSTSAGTTTSASAGGQGGSAQAGGNGGQGGMKPCSGDAVTCYNCCSNGNAVGKSSFESTFASCGGCDMATMVTCLSCFDSICSGQLTSPDNDCIPCVVDFVKNDTSCYGDGASACNNDPACKTFVLCLKDCMP